MSKLLIENPTKLEKIKPKPNPNPRRNSTGNASTIFSQPNPIPNYLRASICSCHDLCKYGGRRESPPESQQNRTRNVRPKSRISKTNNREKRASEAKNPVPTKRTTSKPKPLVRKQTNDKQATHRDNAREGTKVLKTSNKTGSSVKIPSPSKKIKKSAENPKAGDQTEKIKHVKEPNKNIEQTNVGNADDQEGKLGSASCSNPKKKEKVDKPWKKAVGIARAVMKERGSSPIKQRLKKEKALRIGIGEGGFNGSGRRVVGEEDESKAVAECPDTTNMVMGSSKLRISREKVKALVESFETQVNIHHDFRSLRKRRRRKFTC